jgi:hypothetical protein
MISARWTYGGGRFFGRRYALGITLLVILTGTHALAAVHRDHIEIMIYLASRRLSVMAAGTFHTHGDACPRSRAPKSRFT